MNNAEIQIQFPTPGEWWKFTLTAVYPATDGYNHVDRYTQDDIPAEQAPALEATVTAIASMGEEWQAIQVWARLGRVAAGASDKPSVEAVVLTVEAVNADGGRRTFTAADYPEFTITDPAAVAFFKYFTNTNQ